MSGDIFICEHCGWQTFHFDRVSRHLQKKHGDIVGLPLQEKIVPDDNGVEELKDDTKKTVKEND